MAERSGRLAQAAAWLGLALHVAVGVVPYAGSGLVAPPYGIALLWASWVLLGLAWVLLRRSRPWLAALVPVAAVAWWVLVVSLGGWLGGWTA